MAQETTGLVEARSWRSHSAVNMTTFNSMINHEDHTVAAGWQVLDQILTELNVRIENVERDYVDRETFWLSTAMMIIGSFSIMLYYLTAYLWRRYHGPDAWEWLKALVVTRRPRREEAQHTEQRWGPGSVKKIIQRRMDDSQEMTPFKIHNPTDTIINVEEITDDEEDLQEQSLARAHPNPEPAIYTHSPKKQASAEDTKGSAFDSKLDSAYASKYISKTWTDSNISESRHSTPKELGATPKIFTQPSDPGSYRRGVLHSSGRRGRSSRKSNKYLKRNLTGIANLNFTEDFEKRIPSEKTATVSTKDDGKSD